MDSIFRNLAIMCPVDKDEEIAERYKNEPGNRDIFVSKIFTRYSNYLSWYNNKSYYSDQDKESMLLEVIHEALTKFDDTKGVKFKTMLATYLRNRFRYEDELLFARNRSWFLDTTFASGAVDTADGTGTELLELLLGGEEDDYSFELEDSLKTLGLSHNQYRYCQYVLSCNYIPTDAEVARELGISKSGVSVIKSYLREKLKDLLY